MHSFFKKLQVFFILTRAYSLPISIMSWFVPFLFGLSRNGNINFGLLAGLGIIILHLATNLLDDIYDYLKEKREIEKGLKETFNFQKEKCICIRTNKITVKNAIIIDLILFIIAALIAIFFINIFGLKLLYIIILGGILCILYPVLGCLGLGEILVGIIFSPILYSGVYIVMTGNISPHILFISISTGLLTIAILHNHMLLDYKYDINNRKTTLCTLSGNEFNALLLLFFFVTMAYVNLLIGCLVFGVKFIYLLPFLSIFQAAKLIKETYTSVRKIENQDKFINKFMLAQNLMTCFTILLCLSIILDKFI